MKDPAKQAADLLRFTHLRMQAHALMEEAAKLLYLPEHYTAQARAASYFCGDRLHRVIGEESPNDAIAFRDDLEIMARRAVDPLIEAILAQAKAHFPSLDDGACRARLLEALEPVSEALSEAARDLEASREDTIAEGRREFFRAE